MDFTQREKNVIKFGLNMLRDAINENIDTDQNYIQEINDMKKNHERVTEKEMEYFNESLINLKQFSKNKRSIANVLTKIK